MEFDMNASNRNERPNITPLKFWTDYRDLPGKPGEVEEVHWVEYVKKGSNGSTNRELVRRIQKFEPAIFDVIEPYYNAWLKGQEEPVTGTPFGAWPGCNPAQAERFKSMHVRTVEDVAGMNDADMDRFGMGGRLLRDRARAFIEAKRGSAIVADAMAEKDKQIAELVAQVAELTATVKELASDAGLERKTLKLPKKD